MTPEPAPARPIDVMLDIETMGTRPGAAIASIGARSFGAGADIRPFAVTVQLRGQHVYGLHLDADTVLWWLAQDDAARAAIRSDRAATLPEALQCFSRWVEDLRGPAARPIRLWCNGPDFDAALLGFAYHAVGQRTPWHYREVRCLRTLLDLAGVDPRAFPPRVKHDALEDARAQAAAAELALRTLAALVPA